MACGLDVVRYGGYCEGVSQRPSTEAALNRKVAGLLAEPSLWVWVAERAGAVIGTLIAETPERAHWIAPLTRAAKAAYVLLMGVQRDERAQAVRAALSAQLNARVLAAGVKVTLLHYAQVNTLSVPFWSQKLYRPLWTCWEVRSANLGR